MGIITTLLRENHEKKWADTTKQLEGYKSIITMGQALPGMVKPEAMEWAMDNIAALAEGKKAGHKSDGSKESPFKTLLKGITGGLGQLNPSPAAPKSIGQKPEHFFRTQEEQKQFAKEQNEQEEKTKLGNNQQEFELEQAQKKKAAADQIQQDAEKRKQELGERLKAIDEAPFTTEQKQEMIRGAWSDYTRLGKAGPKPSTYAEKRQQLVTDWIDQGKSPEEAERLVAAGETTPKPSGSVAKDKENIALGAWAEKNHTTVDKMTDAQKSEALAIGKDVMTGEFKMRAEIQTVLDNPTAYTPSQIQAAKDEKKKLDTQQTGATLTVVNKANEAAEVVASKKFDAEGPTGPEAKKLRARAALDPSMDLAAWDYLAYEKFDVRGLGKTTQRDVENIKHRAGQIMEDMGLSPGDIFAIRAGLKGNTAAFSKITTVGAQVSQFEETLKLNAQVAKDLSKAYQRSDFQFVNRIQNAFNKGTGDTQALNLAAQLHGVSREWAKIMAGSTSAAGVPINEAAEADKLIGAAISNGQLESLFDNVIFKDAGNRSQAIQAEGKKLLNEIRGSTAPPAKPPASETGPKIVIKSVK